MCGHFEDTAGISRGDEEQAVGKVSFYCNTCTNSVGHDSLQSSHPNNPVAPNLISTESQITTSQKLQHVRIT